MKKRSKKHKIRKNEERLLRDARKQNKKSKE
jgi:hypothetical protein